MGVITGYSSTEKQDLNVEPVTAQPGADNKIHLDTLLPAIETVQTNLPQISNGTVWTINVASHSAQRGDEIVCSVGSNAGFRTTILTTTSTVITVARPFPLATIAGDAYAVYRPRRIPVVNNNVSVNITSSSTSISLSDTVLNGSTYAGTEKLFGSGFLVPDFGLGQFWSWMSTVPESLTGYNCQGPVPMGYDSGFGAFTPIPTSGGGAYIPVEIPLGATVSPYPRQSSSSTITTGTGTVVLNLSNANGGIILIRGTYFNLAATLEASWDSGTTYYAVQGVRLDSNTVESTTGTISSTSRGWKIYAPGATQLRIRATALMSGTVGVDIVACYFGTEVAPGVGSHAVTLTSTTLTSVTPGTAATNLGKAIDSVVGATDTGVAALMQRVDAPGTLTPASGDYAVPRLDSLGRQWVNVGTGSILCSDGNGNKLVMSTAVPAVTDTALVTRGIPFQSTATAPSVSSVAMSTTAATIRSALTTRTKLILFNEGSADVYLRYGTGTPTTTDYSEILYAGQSLRVGGNDIMTCAIQGITASGTATIRYTEW